MQFKTVLLAAVTAGAMSVAANAADGNPRNDSAERSSASQETGNEFLKQFLRAKAQPNDAAEDRPGIDKTMTGSVTKVAKASSDRPYHAIVSRYAAAYGVPEALAHAVITVESNYKASASGSAGEVGLMQIKPATARGMGFRGSVKALYDPETNIKYGMRYLGKAYQLGGGDTCGAILRYNAGHGAKRMNPISASYCAKVRRILGKG